MAIRFVSIDTRSPKEIREALCAKAAAKHGVDPKRLVARDSTKNVCKARWEVWASLRAMGYSTPRIGRIFNRDHSTVIHGLAKHRALAEQEAA